MTIAIHVLKNSLSDFAGSIVAVGRNGAAITFDAPHLHTSHDAGESRRRERTKRVFIVGTEEPHFARTLNTVRKILTKISVPMLSIHPYTNSDGIEIRQYLVKQEDQVKVLVPKVFSGVGLDSPDALRCAERSHLVLASLNYTFCPIDGTTLSPGGAAGIFATFFKEKHRISEIRVEGPEARKSCPDHRERRFPNVYSRCPLCAAKLRLARRRKAKP